MNALSGSVGWQGEVPPSMAAGQAFSLGPGSEHAAPWGARRSTQGALLTWDGRLDNADELRRALGLSASGAPDDVAVVLAAYERWGRECLPRLVGDFALSLWDARDSRLLLARDAFGVRPLYYREEGERLLWGTRMLPLLRSAGLSPTPDEGWVSHFLTQSPTWERTPFQGVKALPAGHALEVSREGRRLWRYWAPRPDAEVRLGSDAEYEERFRELFAESVQARLRGAGTAFVELSGGVDSSSVACMASRLISTGRVAASELRTISFVYEQSPTSDERPFIRAVEERLGAPGLHLGEEFLTLPPLTAPCPELPTYTHCFSRLYEAVSASMQARGARVLLTGVGGDSLSWSEVATPLELADLLSQGRLGEVPRSLGAWRQALEKPYLQLLWEGGLRPLLPAWVRSRLRPAWPVPEWVSPELARRNGLHARRHELYDTGGYGLPSQRVHYGYILADIHALSWHYRCSGASGVELAHPFLHRPLVEFCLAVPLGQLLRGRETRSLHRRALREVVPEQVVWRRSKQGPDEAYHRLLGRQWSRVEELLTDSRLARHGYVEPGRLRAALQQARYGMGSRMLLLLKALAVEYWLRAWEAGNLSSEG